MKNKAILFLAFLFSSLVHAATTTMPTVVEPGNETDFFSQLLDTIVIKIIGVTGNAGIYVVAVVAFCVLAALAAVVLVIAGIILKNKNKK